MSTRIPHDGSYKSLFSHPEMVESLIRDFVPEDWVRGLDFSTLERQNGSYVSDDLRERHDDIVWRVRFRGDWIYVYLLIEFQSAVDPWMALRIMTYAGLLYQDLIRSGLIANGDALPPLFPLVLYNGPDTWTARLDMAELIAPISPSLTRYRPDMRYFLVDEGRLAEDTLTDGLVAHLVRMERSPGPEDLQAILGSLKQKLGARRYQPLRRAFTVWMHRVLLKRLVPREPIPEVNDLEEMETMLAERVIEWTEKWKQEGLQEGRVKGLQEGRVKGLQEGLQEGLQKGRITGLVEGRGVILRRLLTKRFGQDILDIHVQERLRTATPEQLDLWAERILDAKTVDDVFAE